MMETIFGLVFLVSGAAGLFVISMSPRLVKSGGKPLAEPRVLSYLDAWQTVIFDAGHDAPRIRQELLALLSGGSQQRFACGTEFIWHWGLDGKTEREQIVLRHGRSVVFCQVHQYGSDLYVGWDAHLNLGTWREKPIASGIDRETGRRVRLVNVEQATLPTGEYDLVDLNCLLEWTHAQVTKVLKQYLKEREIDQEIDFAIIRGNRQQAATQPGQKERAARKPLRNLFKRTA
jgi:hypothetical protein